jgi:toxin ParE1/3/4
VLDLRLSREADADLTKLFLTGCAQFGEAQTDAYFAAMKERIELLRRFPELGRRVQGSRFPVRVLPAQSHIIIYMATERLLSVIRIAPARSDWLDLIER